jgi:PAS domain S-box-containing protein
MRSTRRNVRQASKDRIAIALALGEELRKSQLRYTHRRPITLADFGAADLSPVPLALISRGGAVLASGAALNALFEATSDQLHRRPLAGLLEPKDGPALFKFLARCERTRETRRAQFSMRLPGKRVVDVLLVVDAVESPDRPGQTLFRAAFVDLGDTERCDVGPRPARANTRLIEALDGIFWEADYPKFTFISPQVERILGFAPKDWTGDPEFWDKHIHYEDRDRVVQARAEAARKPADHVLAYRMVAADRRTIWVKDSAIILAGARGWTGMCGIITDVTDVELAREQLKHANERLEHSIAERTAKMQQSLDAMQTLCYGVAHDLKAPVRALEGFTAFLISDYEKTFDDQAKLYAGRCKIALRRMSELIDGVLSYGRLNHTLPDLFPLDTRQNIQRVINSLELEITNTNARVSVQMTVPRVIGNPYLLEQVVTNLISNALKFTKPGVRPDISISAVEVSQPKGSTGDPPVPDGGSPALCHSSSSGFVRITVADNGIGIPANATDRMFGMFQKLHRPEEYAGTGIGLTLVKRAVELMNGRVGVFSEPGQGSSFWIELPSAS